MNKTAGEVSTGLATVMLPSELVNLIHNEQNEPRFKSMVTHYSIIPQDN